MKDYTLSVRLSDSSTFEVKFEADPSTFTIADLKKVIEPKATPPCPPEQQKLVYKGRILKDADTLETYGTCHGRNSGIHTREGDPVPRRLGVRPGGCVLLTRSPSQTLLHLAVSPARPHRATPPLQRLSPATPSTSCGRAAPRPPPPLAPQVRSAAAAAAAAVQGAAAGSQGCRAWTRRPCAP